MDKLDHMFISSYYADFRPVAVCFQTCKNHVNDVYSFIWGVQWCTYGSYWLIQGMLHVIINCVYFSSCRSCLFSSSQRHTHVYVHSHDWFTFSNNLARLKRFNCQYIDIITSLGGVVVKNSRCHSKQKGFFACFMLEFGVHLRSWFNFFA